MAEHDQYLEVRPGDTLPVDMPIKDSDGNAVPLTDLQGDDLKFVLSRAGIDVLTKIIGDGIEVTDAAKGEVTITLDAADTVNLAGIYRWNVVLTTTSEQVFSVADGRLYTLGAEPVTLNEAKRFLKVEHDEDDAMLSSLITASRQVAEDYTGRTFVMQTLEASIDLCDLRGARDVIDLPRGPVSSVVNVKGYGIDDDEITFDPSLYRLSRDRLILTYSPYVLRARDALVVRYVAGYGDASAVPGPIKLAILRTVATHYENREDELVGTVVARLSADAEALLDAYRVVGL